MANRHRPDPERLARLLADTRCTAHGEPRPRAQCFACMLDRLRGMINDATHPDCAIPEISRALGTPGLIGPENMRELARLYSASRATFAMQLFTDLLRLVSMRR